MSAVYQGLEHALALSKFFPVFPCRDRAVTDEEGNVLPGKDMKQPLTAHGFKDATQDEATIRELWSKGNKNAFVGIPTGYQTGIVVDVDMSTEKGKDGWSSLDDANLDPTGTLTYSTLSGGDHYWYSHTEHLGNAQDLLTPEGVKLQDVDRRGDGGYVIWYGAAPTTKPVFQPLPLWASRATAVVAGADFNGTTEEWQQSLAKGTPSQKVARVITRIPDDFNYETMRKLQLQLIFAGAEGEPGVSGALDQLSGAWLKGKHDTPKNRARFTQALIDGIRKFGGKPKEGAAKKGGNSYYDKDGVLQVVNLVTDLTKDVALGKDGLLYVYDGGVWKLDDTILIRRSVTALGNYYRKANDGTIRNVALSIGLPELPEVPNVELLNFRNVVLNWKTKEVLEHSPDQLSTVQLPIDFIPGAECPLFDRWLSEVVPADAIPLVYEAIAYMLVAGNPLQRAFLLKGPGHSGKSTFLRLLEELLGSHNVSNASFTQLTSDRFAPADLYGKIANLSGDNASSYLEDSSIFKQITGDDVIRGERKYAHGFSFKCWATPVFSANEFWHSKDITDSYYRRWLVLPFPNKVERRADFSEAAIHAEAPGILNRVLPYLPALMERQEFTESVSAVNEKEAFKDGSDTVRRWLKSDAVIFNPEQRTSRKEAFQSYKQWASEEEVKAVSRTTFYERVRNIGLNADLRSGGVDYIAGLWVAPPSYVPGGAS